MKETTFSGLSGFGCSVSLTVMVMAVGAMDGAVASRMRTRPLVSSGPAFGCTLITTPPLTRSSTAVLIVVRVQVPAAKWAAITGSIGTIGAVLVSGSRCRHHMSCSTSLASGGVEMCWSRAGSGLALLLGRWFAASSSPGVRALLRATAFALPAAVSVLVAATCPACTAWAVTEATAVGGAGTTVAACLLALLLAASALLAEIRSRCCSVS